MKLLETLSILIVLTFSFFISFYFGHQGLMPLDDPTIWYNRIQDIQYPVLLIGHLPHLDKLLGLLLNQDSGKTLVHIDHCKPISIMQSDEKKWVLDWVASSSFF